MTGMENSTIAWHEDTRYAVQFTLLVIWLGNNKTSFQYSPGIYWEGLRSIKTRDMLSRSHTYRLYCSSVFRCSCWQQFIKRDYIGELLLLPFLLQDQKSHDQKSQFLGAAGKRACWLCNNSVNHGIIRRKLKIGPKLTALCSNLW